VKINVDAAVGKNTGVGAQPAIARSNVGQYLGASSVMISGKFDPKTLENLACREGLALARDIDARVIRVASDCLDVVQSINEGKMGGYAHIVCGINEARDGFQEITFCHEGRRSNGEAHHIARSAILDDLGHRLWLVAPPEGLCIPATFEL
jgi:ribonuclease HI